jgi:hypothetical protein
MGLRECGLFSVKSMYIDYMDDHTKYLHKYLWKIKVPLKIRFFMWFLHKKVLLIKDNLIKRKWKETAQHLFSHCPLAKMVWSIVYMAFGIIPPSIKNLFRNWLVGVSKQERAHSRVGACTLVWAIWKVRNDYIFNNEKSILLCR